MDKGAFHSVFLAYFCKLLCWVPRSPQGPRELPARLRQGCWRHRSRLGVVSSLPTGMCTSR